MTTYATPDQTATHDQTAKDAQTGAADSARPPSAQIIPFPAKAGPRAKVDSRLHDAPDPQERLARALASLDRALSEQRAAMSGWRESLGELRKATTGLGLSMQRYHRTLGKLGTDVSELHAEALRLERWADDTLAQTASQTASQTPIQTPIQTPAGTTMNGDTTLAAGVKAVSRHE